MIITAAIHGMMDKGTKTKSLELPWCLCNCALGNTKTANKIKILRGDLTIKAWRDLFFFVISSLSPIITNMIVIEDLLGY